MQPDAVRQVAAIVLRKRIGGHWSKFDTALKTALKTEILTVLSSEPQRIVRNGAVGVAATMCKLECGEEGAAAAGGNAWPELFQFIAKAAGDANGDARELAFLLLGEMTETIGLHLKPQFPSMATLFANALNDSETKVQNASVKALGQLLSYLADEK